MIEALSNRKRWFIVCLCAFLLFIARMALVSFPVWVLLSGAAAEFGRRFIKGAASTKTTFKMNFISRLLPPTSVSVTSRQSEAGLNEVVEEVHPAAQQQQQHQHPQEPPDGLKLEVERYIRIIMQEYISSWYVNVSSNNQFPSEIRYALDDFMEALESRIRRLNSTHFTIKFLTVYHQYFQNFIKARRCASTSIRLEDAFQGYHYALMSDKTEREHLYNVVNVLMEVLVPADILCCPAGRRLVVSLLAQQVMFPLVNLLSDPQFINRCMVLLMGLDPDVQDDQGTRSNSLPAASTSSTTALDRRLSSSSGRLDVDERFGSDAGGSGEFMEGIWQRMVDDLPSTFKVERQQEVKELLSSQNLNSSTLPQSSSLDRISDLLASGLSFENISNKLVYYIGSSQLNKCRSQSSSEVIGAVEMDERDEDDRSNETTLRRNNGEFPRSDFQVSSGLEGLLKVTTGPILSEKLPNVCRSNGGKIFSIGADDVEFEDLEGQAEDTQEATRPESISPVDVVDNEELLHTQGNPFIKLEITDTEVKVGTRPGSRYVVYCIQYDGWFPDADTIRTVDMGSYIDVLEPRSVLQTVTVKRRFREFVTLHSRLENQLKSNSFFKSVKGPTKWSIIPFGKLDKDIVETRKRFLENYLQTLILNEEVTKCKCIREFLAYGSDGRIAFSRKSSDGGQLVPRLDKLLMKKMTGVLDKLKTALPSLPTESSATSFGSSQTPSPGEAPLKASDRFLGYFNISPSGNQDGTQSVISFDYGLEEETATSLESRISRFLQNYDANSDKVELAFDAAEMDKWTKDPWTHNTTSIPTEQLRDQSLKPEVENGRVQDNEDDVAEAVINLFVEAWHDNSFFNRLHLIYIAKQILGDTLNSWIGGVLDSCTTEESFVKYLQTIREKLWPTNTNVKISYKPAAYYYEMARRALNNCVPGMIKKFIGQNQIDENVTRFLDSFQSPKLLRHLVYCLLDLLVDDLLVKSRSQSILERLGSLA